MPSQQRCRRTISAFACSAFSIPRHLFDVGADAESPRSAAREDDSAQVAVAYERQQSFGEGVCGRGAHDVQAAAVVNGEISNDAFGAFFAPDVDGWMAGVQQPSSSSVWPHRDA
jgi:hypothetical protein